MFTGIVEEMGKVIAAVPGHLTISAADVLQGIRLGDSMAVNGVCLTVTDFKSGSFSVDVMEETLRRTNLGLLNPEDTVNLERPLTLNGRLGGHLVQGHIDNTGKITVITPENNAVLMRIEAPPEVMRYIVTRGFIAVDGASLTVVDRESGSFTVSLVGFTRRNTTLGTRRIGDRVNLEADIIAKYVEQFNRARPSEITTDFLNEHGFLLS